jgi:hypothetical protein
MPKKVKVIFELNHLRPPFGASSTLGVASLISLVCSYSNPTGGIANSEMRSIGRNNPSRAEELISDMIAKR